ncbi:GNAT family N-acetyltransferase [Kitasatospora sp. NPDC127121]|uniref:GNAT family N-acetyltransferase n=1 Tax=Kitasatospora sp. NPDC127121 TaxID=3345371 RepID=UPI003635D481
MIELRELTPGDAGAVQRIYGPEPVKFLGRSPLDAADARRYVAHAITSAQRTPRLLHTLGLTVNDDLLGVVKLHLDRAAAALSYILRADAWGRGYATEGVRKALALGLGHLRLPEIHARHHPANPASGRVLLKAGFTPTGEHAGFLTYAIRPAGRPTGHPQHTRSTTWNEPSSSPS